ncbi:DEAD/DEAH box helicase [Sulfurimonas sp. SAG-AH-194-I05]|nr:DEAD/DEAH box helicase [Sulfurimonas sp. SAG-AH-194-I05]MDF1875650.1 DEAD/DEAH box helicase [Sulfurimonas sp. SAG-AH-194-I05]
MEEENNTDENNQEEQIVIIEEKKEEVKSEKKYYDFISVGKRTAQKLYFIAQHDKNIAIELLLKNADTKQRIVVCKSKKSADALHYFLKDKDIKSLSIHGNHKTEQVEDARRSFSVKETTLLITTDMILKSLELKNVDEVISYDLPIDPQDYFYRLRLVDEVGYSIIFVSSDDEKNLEVLELTMRCEIEDRELDGFEPSPAPRQEKKRKKQRHRKIKVKTKPL